MEVKNKMLEMLFYLRFSSNNIGKKFNGYSYIMHIDIYNKLAKEVGYNIKKIYGLQIIKTEQCEKDTIYLTKDAIFKINKHFKFIKNLWQQ